MIKNPIICAIDSHDFNHALIIINEIHQEVGAIKLGLEFFMAFGLNGIQKIINQYQDLPIFLDLKFHDIPNTVQGAFQSIINLKNIFLTTIHAQGGAEMIKAAVNTAQLNPNLKIIAVTKLTSLEINKDEIFKLTELALTNGAHGIVAPAGILKEIRSKFGNDFLVITPGIRLANSNIVSDDQKSIATPEFAMSQGASYLVIGRPITESNNKIEIVKKIEASIASSLR